MFRSKLAVIILSSVIFTITVPIPVYAGQWQISGPTWTYIKDDGTKATSEWIIDNGEWYHFDDKSIMETGWIMDDEKYYFLGAGGAMYSNRYTPTGYYLGADGAWIPNYSEPTNDSDSSNANPNHSSNSGSTESNTGGSTSSGIESLEPGLTDGPN